jgi:hypothetical protein
MVILFYLFNLHAYIMINLHCIHIFRIKLLYRLHNYVVGSSGEPDTIGAQYSQSELEDYISIVVRG